MSADHKNKNDWKESLLKLPDLIFERYCRIVLFYPKSVIAWTLLTSIALIAISGIFYRNIIDFDPAKGFETRGTYLSDARLTLDAISTISAKATEILRSGHGNKRSIDQKSKIHRSRRKREDFDTWNIFKDPGSGNDWRKRREVEGLFGEIEESDSNETTTIESFTVNYDDYGVSSEPTDEDLKDPCNQYMQMGDRIPYGFIEYMAKIIVQVESYDKLFTLPVFQELCGIDEVIRSTMKVTHYQGSSTKFQNSFNLPYYSTCINFNVENKCSSLNQNDINELRAMLKNCSLGSPDAKCTSNIVLQLQNYILPREHTGGVVNVGVILPITLSNGGIAADFYSKLLHNLNSYLQKDVALKGAYFNVKNNQFSAALAGDAKIAAVSAVLVILCFLFYSRSIFFSFIILTIIFMSMGVAFFIYAAIFAIDFFPFLNLLVIVLMIAIGADDAFLLLVYFRRERKNTTSTWKVGEPYLPLYRDSDVTIRALRSSLKHSLSSMFVTSATTAVAFLSNLYSDVIVLRCFGIFACLTVLVNYLLVVLLLPSTMMLTCTSRNTQIVKRVNLADSLSSMVYRSRYVIIIFGIILTVMSAIVVFYRPGMIMPRYNPTKLLRNSDPYEWYDNNNHIFNFQWKRKQKIMQNYVIGMEKIKSSNSLSPKSKGELRTKAFTPTIKELQILEKDIAKLFKENQNNDYDSWISQFLKDNSSCLYDKTITSTCFRDFSLQMLPSEFPENFAVIPSDGPIFDHSMQLIGYFIAIPSNATLTLDTAAISEVMEDIEQSCYKFDTKGVLCLSSSEISQYFDVVSRLRQDTFLSVLLSVCVSLLVVVLCTRTLLLSLVSVLVICAVILWTTASLVVLGWELSVVESTIVILTIGLSFDYTLHYAVSYKDTSSTNVVERLSSTASSAGRACVLGAVTSVLCGIPLLWASTAAFFEVGSMLISLGLLSLLGASILFPAAISCLHRCDTVHILRF